jgi:hypothetical protein
MAARNLASAWRRSSSAISGSEAAARATAAGSLPRRFLA